MFEFLKNFKSEKPAEDLNDFEAIVQLDQIHDYIEILPEEVSHWLANLDDADQGDDYCLSMITSLKKAVSELEKMLVRPA